MIRAPGLRSSLATIGLAFAAVAAPARAADPAAEPAEGGEPARGAPPARAAEPAKSAQPGQAGQPARARPGEAAAKASQVHLWWNDPELVAKLSLTADQRGRMDRLFEAYQKEARGGGGATLPKARAAFHAALRQGDVERARAELAAWAESERGQVQAYGDLKLGVLSLLSAEQRKTLGSLQPDLVALAWAPRPSWKAWQPPTKVVPPQKQPAN
jgi:hypothetical protein